MDMKEKLVEIVFKSLCRHIHKSCKLAENIVDDLIANGVTFKDSDKKFLVIPKHSSEDELMDMVGQPAILARDDANIIPIIQEWHPVSDPPKKNGRYLVYDCDTGNYYDSYYDETEGEFGEWQNCFDPYTLGVIECLWNSCPNVTHWMPLPQPPKGE